MADPVQLRDGSTTSDPRLGRLVDFDERSRDFPIMATLDSDKRPVTRGWMHNVVLDQGSEGACVGFAWSHELDADPVMVPGMTYESAIEVYKEAQKIDQWPGEDYSGTSVLAGAKVLKQKGYLDEYRWAFGIDDVLMTLSWHGPVVLGIRWYSDMYNPDADMYIRPTGNLVGGHAIMAVGYVEYTDDVWLLNSWGPDWGHNGLCRIKVTDLAMLLDQQGEACVPVVRGTGTPPLSKGQQADADRLTAQAEARGLIT